MLRLALLALACAALLRAQPLPQPGGGPPLPPLHERSSPNFTGNPFMHVWRPEDYAAGPTNTAIVQHPSSGYIFVGNNEGVLKFDGARWRLIPLPRSEPVHALAIDLRGRVWAAGESEIARLETDAVGVTRAVTVVHPLPDGENGQIESALAADDGIWFRGLQHILRVGPDDTVSTWATKERFGSMWLMQGAVHATVSERDMVRLDAGGQFATLLSRENFRVPSNRRSPLKIFAAKPAPGGDTLLLTPAGPFRWNAVAGTLRPMPIRPAPFRENEVLMACFLPDGAMVFVTTRPAGMLVNPDGQVERLLDRLPVAINPRVSHMTADREGGLWLSSRDHLARVQVRSAYVRHEGAHGLQGNPRQILRVGETLFVGHSEGVSRHVPWPGVFPPVEGLRRGADALAVVDGRLIAAAAGLVEVPLRVGSAIPISDLAITSVCGVQGAAGMLVAGDAQGAAIFQRQEETWRLLGRLKQLKASVRTLYDDGAGGVWGATSDGRLWRADFRSGVSVDAPVTVYGPERGVHAPASVRRVQFFQLGGALVASSAAWLLRHDATQDRFEPEKRIAGLEGTGELGAEAVTQNRDGDVWLRMATPDRRLLRVVSEGLQRWRVNERPAPLLRDLTVLSMYEDGDTLWIAGADKLVSLDLDYRPLRPMPPLAVHLRRATASGGNVIWAEGARRAEVNLAVGEDSLRIEFSAPSFIMDHRGRSIIEYRTQLIGLERGWSPWSPESWRDFSRLPPGTYAFRVEATDHAGRRSPDATLAIIVTAPWWRTRWAWIGYAASAGLVVLAGVGLRTRALRKRAALLEATVATRTEELRRTNAELARLHRLELDEKAAARLAEEQARLEVLRYQLNPHFLYNALNSVYSLALTAPPAAANMVLKLADFCRVALDRRGEDHTTIGAEFDKLSNYLEIEKVRWGETLHIAVEADAAARRVRIPPFLLLPLVENAIKYGGATSPEALHVRVVARRAETGALDVEVANSGRWVERDAAAIANGKSSGIGLTNLRQRLERYFPGAHDLVVEKDNGWVVVRLRIAERGLRNVQAVAVAVVPSGENHGAQKENP